MYIRVKVTASARKEELVQTSPDHFEIKVREPAERNEANTRVLELLSAHFGIPVGKVRIINGHHHPTKLLVVES